MTIFVRFQALATGEKVKIVNISFRFFFAHGQTAVNEEEKMRSRNTISGKISSDQTGTDTNE